MRYAPPKGAVAVPPRAWNEEFNVVFGRAKTEHLFEEEGPYAVVEISGPLTQHAGWMGDSYDEIKDRVAAALDGNADAVCLRIDSPGGDWCGALELSRDLRAMAKKAGKRLVAFTDGMALSAGYAIACAAEEIVATESASVGSVGVWAPLIDLTAQDAMRGARVLVVASGTAKADRNPHVGITDEAYTRLQAQVDEQAEMFFELVAECRGLPVSKIRAIQGADVFGQRGVAAGLTDRLVNSWATFLNAEDSSMGAKASKYDEAYGLLKQAAEGDDEDAAKKAKKCLKAMEEEEPKEKKDEKEAKAKAESDEKDKDAKAKADGGMDLARRLHALESERAAEKEETERNALLAKRPDFSPEVRATLAKAPLTQLREAVEKWPKIGSRLGEAAAASQSGGTRGRSLDETASGPRERDPASMGDEDFIAHKMGLSTEGTGIRSQGKSLELGFMTAAQASKFLADRKAATDAGKGT